MKLQNFALAFLGVAICATAISMIYSKEIKSSMASAPAETKPSPCDLPYDPTPVFNGMWIGMPRAQFDSSITKIDYAPESTLSGVITWETRWTNGHLSRIYLEFTANPVLLYQSIELTKLENTRLALSAWMSICRQRYSKCDFPEDIDQPDIQMVECGRSWFLFSSKDNYILISDACVDDLEKAETRRQDSIAAEKSKALFQ